MNSWSRTLFAILAVTLVSMTCGCNVVGPRAIRGARQSYNEAVVQTWNEQLLLNLVRLRYRETPFFLQIGSITTQYEFLQSAGTSILVDPFSSGGDVISGNLGLEFSEQPTVSYAPLQGAKFVRQLMAPISLDALVLLSTTGWSIERVLRLTVNRVNALWNAPSASGPTPDRIPEYEEFLELTHALRTLQERRALYIEVAKKEGGYALEVLLDPSGVDPESAAQVRERLQLDPNRDSYDLDMVRDENESAVVLLTRSLLGVMYFLSHSVEVPVDHVREGRVTVTLDETGSPYDWSVLLGDLMTIRSSSHRPATAFVSVHHRGHWFYIDDTDIPSKSTFGLLAQLFNLQAGDSAQSAPLLTLPVGG